MSKTEMGRYREVVSELKAASDRLTELETGKGRLVEQRTELSSRREKLLADSIAGDAESAVAELSKLNARAEVCEAKISHIDGRQQDAEADLQGALSQFETAFGGLYRSFRGHLVGVSTEQIASLVHPKVRDLQRIAIESLAWASTLMVDAEALEIHLGHGWNSPLSDTPGVPWSQYRTETVGLLRNSAQAALGKADALLNAVEAAKGFSPPGLAVTAPDPAVVEVKETELAEAL